jgi:hypothetical protein
MPTTTATDKRQPIPNEPPPGWEREIPRYRVSRDVHASPKSRHRFEPPFASSTDNDCWQYAERDYKAGDLVETREWPHPSFFPLNYSAKKVLEFFNSRIKSRLPRTPYGPDGRLRLDDGLTGTLPDHVATPRIKSTDLRPAS